MLKLNSIISNLRKFKLANGNNDREYRYTEIIFNHLLTKQDKLPLLVKFTAEYMEMVLSEVHKS
jgi:hypothetical protein